jgi:hypothetical protein
MDRPVRSRPLGRHRLTWKDNIKKDFRAVGRRGTNWNNLTQDRDRWWVLVNAVIDHQASYSAENFVTR